MVDTCGETPKGHAEEAHKLQQASPDSQKKKKLTARLRLVLAVAVSWCTFL